MCVLDATLADLSTNVSAHKGYHGAAVGKGRQLAKTELEKLKLSELSTRDAVFEAARM
jgi:20S proteasome alpha/beta subunit